MSTSTSETQEPRIQKITFEGGLMRVLLDDRQQITVPVMLYPRLHFATMSERRNFRLIAKGRGIHWPDLEEDISLEGLLQRRGSSESPQSLLRWLTARKARLNRQKAVPAEIQIKTPGRQPQRVKHRTSARFVA